MNIIETNLLDLHEDNINDIKIDLANRVITNIAPFFDNKYETKYSKLIELKEIIKKKTNEIQNKKKILQKISSQFEKEKKIKKLLDRISNLIDNKLVTETGYRNEVILMLRTVDKLSENQIDKYLQDTLEVINKKIVQKV